MGDQTNNPNIPEQPEPQQPIQTEQQWQPYTGPPPNAPQKKKSKWWIWLIVAVVAVGLIVAALFIFNVFGLRRAGNAGVWAAYDYINSLEERHEKIVGRTQKELSARLDKQAFEIDGEIDIESDLIAQLDFGFDRIGADFQVKYDLVDMGMKLNLMNFISADMYLIEDEVVVGLFDQAYSLPLEIDNNINLDEEMPLADRVAALNSMSGEQDFEELLLRVITEFAPAVSNDLSEREKVDMYSPLLESEVQMNAITTTIDENDLYDIVTGFGENLEENEDLIEDLQNLVDTLSQASGEETDIEDMIDEMMSMDEEEFEDMDPFEFSWTVYKYKGEYVGISVFIEAEGEEVEAVIMTQFSKDTMFSSLQVDYNGSEVATLISEQVFTDDDMTIDMVMVITVPEGDYSQEETITISILGESTFEKDNSTEYVYTGDFSVDIDAGDSFAMLGMGKPITVDIEISADCLFDSHMDSLRDDDDWNEIYDKDWGEIEDLMDALSNLPFDLPNGDF